MKRFKDIERFIEGKAVFCGIDLHKQFWVVCTYCDGQIVEQQRLVGDKDLLLRFLARYRSARRVACVYEAGFSGFWLYRILVAAGYECMVTPPGLIPQTTSKVKTDKLDARKLATYHAGGLLKSVWVPAKALESDRRICRRRRQLVKQHTRAKNYIRSFLLLHDLRRPEQIKSNWSRPYLEWLSSLQFEEASDNFAFGQCLRNYQRLRADLAEINNYFRKLSRSERYCKTYQLLSSAPGIGLITGLTLTLEIYDFGRFQSGDHFASFLGMTPSQFSSGERVHLGHITRQGSGELRRLLIESAWLAIRKDPLLGEKYARIKARGSNGKKAILAVARSLAIRAHRGVLDGTGYVIGTC